MMEQCMSSRAVHVMFLEGGAIGVSNIGYSLWKLSIIGNRNICKQKSGEYRNIGMKNRKYRNIGMKNEKYRNIGMKNRNYRNIGMKNDKYGNIGMKNQKSQVSEYRNEKWQISEYWNEKSQISEYREPIAPSPWTHQVTLKSVLDPTLPHMKRMTHNTYWFHICYNIYFIYNF